MINIIKNFISNLDFYLTLNSLANCGEYDKVKQLMQERTV